MGAEKSSLLNSQFTMSDIAHNWKLCVNESHVDELKFISQCICTQKTESIDVLGEFLQTRAFFVSIHFGCSLELHWEIV